MNWLIISIALLGFVPMLLLLWKRRRVTQLLQTGKRVTGQVEQLELRRGFKGVVYYRAVIRYPVNSGNVRRGIYIFSSSREQRTLQPGQPVELVFHPSKPEKFIPVDQPLSLVPLYLTAIFAIGLLVLCYLIYKYINL